MTPPADVVVVGAGIVGASVAYHLARTGALVTLLERSVPASGASGDSFAWIGRGTDGAPPEQLPLRRSVLEDYRRLERELPGSGSAGPVPCPGAPTSRPPTSATPRTGS